jgi:hypothetical protein
MLISKAKLEMKKPDQFDRAFLFEAIKNLRG